MSVELEYRSGALSRVGAMVAKVVKVERREGVESLHLETLDGTAVTVYGSPGFVESIMDAAIVAEAARIGAAIGGAV